jgi:2-haloacid dehalogenase
MAVTLAFDVYGTLIDTHGVISALEKYVDKDAAAFSRIWREKQLEYSFRRGLMQNYENFAVCTSDALDYTSSYFQAPLSAGNKEELLGVYKLLPAFADVEAGLSRARKAGFRIFAFSNGSLDAVETLLRNAGLRDYFLGVVSVDEIKSFKPNPAVYSHFLRKADAVGADAWLVSSNPFDVIGAVSAGMRSAWVKRAADAIFDPWGIEPTITVSNLVNLAERIARNGNTG